MSLETTKLCAKKCDGMCRCKRAARSEHVLGVIRTTGADVKVRINGDA